MSESDSRIVEAFPDVALTPIEKALLGYLFDTRHRFASKGELLREVWGYSEAAKTRTVQTTVQRLRAKIEPDPSTPTVLLNVRGRGYQLHPPGGKAVEAELEALRAQLAALLGRGQTIVGVLTEGAPEAGLPVERDAFVGREEAVTEAMGLLDQPLVTLLGGPGVGKTRLATRLARSYRDGGRGEAWFSDLADAHTVEDFWSSISRALGVVALGGSELAPLVCGALASRCPGLLVLDNLEQLVDVVPAALGQLLEASGDLVVLATSRERLRLSAERVLRLGPLSAQEAEALFEERVRAARPGISVEPSVVARIVRRLEGVPLALELAAARARIMPLAELANRLDERIELPNDRRDAPPRQSSLEQAIAWSWELLSDEERGLLGEVSVFAGGAPLDALQAVSASKDRAPELVGSLMDKSLLRQVGDAGEERFSCLESVRQFARDHTDPDRRSGAAARHAAWYTLGAEQSAAAYDQDPVAARFMWVEFSNLVSALDYMIWLGLPQAALLAQYLWRLQVSHGQPLDYSVRLDKVLALPGLTDADKAGLAMRKAHIQLGDGDTQGAEATLAALPALPAGSLLDAHRLLLDSLVAQGHGRLEEASELGAQSAAMARAGGWPVLAAKAEIARSAALLFLFREAEAEASAQAAVELASEAGALRVAAVAWANIGGCRRARDAREEALSRAEVIARRFDDRSVLHGIASVRASQLLHAGELEEADRVYTQLFLDVRRMGGRAVPGSQHVNGGLLSLRLGRWAQARERLLEGRQRLSNRDASVMWTLALAYLGIAERYVHGEEAAKSVFEELGESSPALGPQVALAVRLSRAHVPGLEDVDAVIAEARPDPALAGLVEMLESATRS